MRGPRCDLPGLIRSRTDALERDLKRPRSIVETTPPRFALLPLPALHPGCIGVIFSRVTADDLIMLLGYSIKSKEIRAAMRTLRMRAPRARIDSAGDKYEATSTNPKKDISLVFDGYRRYHRDFGDPLFVSDTTGDELILTAISLDGVRKASTIALPFGLSPGDPAAALIAKLGRKPTEKSSDVAYGHAWWFRFDEYRLLVGLDPKLRVLLVRVFRLTSSERAKVRLRRDLRKQNANIRPDSASSILATELPTVKWQWRKAAGDTSFTREGIKGTAVLLKAFLLGVADHVRHKSASGIYGSVKRVVRSLNRLNARHEGFIETMEREELCEFINETVRATGLETVQHADLTEEWRQW